MNIKLGKYIGFCIFGWVFEPAMAEMRDSSGDVGEKTAET
jgi:hypothetical protein